MPTNLQTIHALIVMVLTYNSIILLNGWIVLVAKAIANDPVHVNFQWNVFFIVLCIGLLTIL